LFSILFLVLRSPSYEATADLLVEPLPQDDELFLGLPLLRDTGDPVRTVETAASLLSSPETADRVSEELGGSPTGEELLESVVAIEPQGGSNIIAITATADTANEAARIANTYAETALEVRGNELSRQADELIAELETRLDDTPRADTETRAALATRLEQLRTVIDSGDPTLVASGPAVPPNASEGASPILVVFLAIIAGLTLGIGTAIVLELMTRRVRDEEELVALYPMPILARVPHVGQRRQRGPRGAAWYMPPEITEPFRTLTVQLERGGRVPSPLMITSPTKGDGKTSSAINLAVSLAATGSRVILLDFDLRNPRVGSALGLARGYKPTDLLEPSFDLETHLVQPSENFSLSVLPVLKSDPIDGHLSEPATWGLPHLIDQAESLADYVVVDTPPLGEVSDAARVASAMASILLVVRPGNTNRAHLRTTRELLERIGKGPDGCIMLGAPEPTGGYYGYGVGGAAPDLVLASTNDRPRSSGKPRPPKRRVPSE
jgi:Mrp family chromosome partitioning ATPase/capsular polysaccharide biosynthesis protein